MKKKLLTICDLEDLNNAAEYIISTAQFNFYQFDEDGKYIAFDMSSEERTVRLNEWIEKSKNHYLCFRHNKELQKITFDEALEMPLSEVKEIYLKDHLKTLRTILRYDTADMNGVVVSDDVPDSYLDDLLALRWRGNLVLWTMQWKHGKTRSEEGLPAPEQRDGNIDGF